MTMKGKYPVPSTWGEILAQIDARLDAIEHRDAVLYVGDDEPTNGAVLWYDTDAT